MTEIKGVGLEVLGAIPATSGATIRVAPVHIGTKERSHIKTLSGKSWGTQYTRPARTYKVFIPMKIYLSQNLQANVGQPPRRLSQFEFKISLIIFFLLLYFML